MRRLEFEYLLCNVISCGILSNEISQEFKDGADESSDFTAIAGTGDMHGGTQNNVSCDCGTSLSFTAKTALSRS